MPGEPRPVGDFQERLKERLRDLREAPVPLGDPEDPPEPSPLGEHLRECGLPEKSCRFVDEHGLEALRARGCGKQLEDFLGSKQLVAVLTGVPGAGKTTLCALAYDRMRRRKDGWDSQLGRVIPGWEYDASECGFIHARILARLHAGWVEHQPRLERLERLELLVLNDLGMEEDDDRTMQRKTEALLCERDEACLRTIITTNLSPQDISKRYGARVASRFAQEAKIISCGELDLRRSEREVGT